MSKIKIITDSTADIPKQLREKLNIDIIPLYVTIGEKTYKDTLEIDFKKLYELVDYYNELPKSSAPSVYDFTETFKRYINEGYEIIFFSISSELSATYQNACIAAKEVSPEKISIVDSRNLSLGIGILAIEAAEMALEGFSRESIIERINLLIPKVRGSFVIETLRYLHMGGRCSSVQMLAGSLLKIQPQIVVENGFMHVGTKYRGNKEKVLTQYFSDFIENRSFYKGRLILGHSECINGLQLLKDKSEKISNVKEIIFFDAGAVISTHCGPGTVGVFYIED
ncbi:DegV family protein [Caldicellulosiruptoraceae bacterium PP1]